jgi:hypothetical protein
MNVKPMNVKPFMNGIVKTCILFTLSVFLTFSSKAQNCLVSSLSINTGEAITSPPTMLSSGQPEPSWRVSTTSSLYGPLSNANPLVVTPHSQWGTNGAAWISISQTTANGITCTTDEVLVFTREFRICEEGTLEFDMNILADNYVASVSLLDNTQTPIQVMMVGTANQNMANMTTGYNVNNTYTLQQGTYFIEIQMANFGIVGQPNPVGIAVSGTISEVSANNSIVNDLHPDCQEFECGSSDCSDICYWRVEGNNILNGNNIFGTRSPDHVRIHTSNTQRGIFTSNGLLGWNTSTPSALLHVDCAGNNPEDGSNGSDVRFENLEPGSGSILAIDDNTGYVYNTGIPTGTSSVDWHVGGNTATTTDYIGTNNDIDFRFYTNGLERMRIKNQGADFDAGFVAIHTTAPTARLHVNCNDGNDPSNPGLFNNSDIRFENLEMGTGSILSIDPAGYVYNTGVDISTLGGNDWSLNGNNANPGEYLGTNNDEDLRLYTRGTQKMMIKGVGTAPAEEGFIGMNTSFPTARLHVDCIGGNGMNGNGNWLSDVRFENLEDGEGEYLVIDGAGYVYRTRTSPDGGESQELFKLYEEEKEKNQQLEARLNVLEARLAALENPSSADNQLNSKKVGNTLYQNAPNPFGDETVIKYHINVMEHSADIVIYDLNGREIAKYNVGKGEGSIVVKSNKLVPGMYLYSLVVDGQAEETKRMVFTK